MLAANSFAMLLFQAEAFQVFIPSRTYQVPTSCCCDLDITCIKAGALNGIPKEAARPQESTKWDAHGISFGSHSNKQLQPLKADHQGVMGTSAVRPGSHSGTGGKRTGTSPFHCS